MTDGTQELHGGDCGQWVFGADAVRDARGGTAMTEAQATKPTVGFIGLGAMGSRMAGRLLAAGYPLGVYNRTPDRARPLAERGARVYDSPRDLARNADVVLSSLTD